MPALRVTELARDRELHRAVHDRLMDAYWAEARNIGDPEELRVLAVEAGLDPRRWTRCWPATPTPTVCRPRPRRRSP